LPLTAATTNAEALKDCFHKCRTRMKSPGIHKVASIRNDDYVSDREQTARNIVDISLVINPEAEVVNLIHYCCKVQRNDMRLP
jgi:hypothetical protein